MKCKTSYLFVGLITFFIGCSAVVLLINKCESTEEIVLEVSPKIEEKETRTKIEKGETPFDPQIKGLEDFPEWDQTKYKTKLVDVEHSNNSYRKSEVVAKTGENWLGLYIDSENSYIKNSKVKVISDDEYGYADEETVKLEFRQNRKPFILLKNSKSLKEGSVTTLYHKVYDCDEEVQDTSNVINRNFHRDFQINNVNYRLSAKDAETKSGEKVLALVLETEYESQIVTYGPYFNGEFLGHLLWVGDLDNDGKIDLYINFNDFEKGYFDSKLYLSSEAEKGKLVKEVAGFFTAGC